MPANSGLSFVLVQHLDPSHDTLMPELLAKHTSMPVSKAQDGESLQPNRVYVIAPNCCLRVKRCAFLVERLEPGGDAKVIDVFFRSAAADQNESVIGIVLSGTGGDGTLGLKAIKEHGGLTVAQHPETARYDGMPRSAIATGCVDFVLPVEEMARKVVEYGRHLQAMQHRKSAEALQQEVVENLPKICPILRKRTGHDFSRYKESTLARRIQRRMQLLHIESAAKYADCLARRADEVDALFKDLLISVTQFFRDPESFEALAKQVLPEILREKGADAPVRVWAPGCATGEEAYTLAILLAEQTEKRKRKPNIQIFATDLDTEALDFARRGRYAAEVAQQVSPARLKRFFRKVGDKYELADSIREMCVFSLHNLIKDPPFSRLDLISCRNVLIYLEADLQRRLLPLFHYALNPSGFLFLGPSENIASRSELFKTFDPKHRLFQRRPSLLQAAATLPVIDPGRVTRLQPPSAAAPTAVSKEQNVARLIERVIVDEYAPTSAVINEDGEVVYFAGDTGKFLKPPAGAPSNKLVSMARQNLRLELRTLIHRAVSTRKEAVRHNLRVRKGAETLQLDLIVRPLAELGSDAGLFIVLFRELIPSNSAAAPAVEDFGSHEHPVIKQLESELRATRENLQTTIEELETSNEELKSANEELVSMNEELQSANEELQTSKEEVQSANDELQRKIEETDLANMELRRAHQERALYAAIVENSDDAIIGKSLDGLVTSWNGAAERIFGYSAREMIDQSILRIIPPERHEEEGRILQRLRRGERVEHYETERLTKSGRTIQVSLTSSPIRDQQGNIVGASKIARDITVQKAAARASQLLAAIVDSSDDAIASKRLDGTVTSWNKGAERLFGYTAEEMIGQPITRLFPEDRLNEEPQIIKRIASGERVEHFETIRKRKDGSLIDVSLTISPVKDSQGRIIGASKIARNITAQKQLEKALEAARDELEARVKERTASLQETTEQLETFCYTVAHDLRSPLRAQQAYANALIEDYSARLDADGVQYAQRILRNAERLDTLVNDLLSYSRLSRGELKFENASLERIVADVTKHLADDIAKSGAVINVGPLHSVVAYAPTLNLIVTNLISNALKFVKPGQAPIVNVRSEASDGAVKLWVEDNGIGIHPDGLNKIFGVFQRLHPVDKYPGTGIGLAIVQKGAERMGGSAGAESKLGEGSRFWVKLPAAPAETPSHPASAGI